MCQEYSDTIILMGYFVLILDEINMCYDQSLCSRNNVWRVNFMYVSFKTKSLILKPKGKDVFFLP